MRAVSDERKGLTEGHSFDKDTDEMNFVIFEIGESICLVAWEIWAIWPA